jgi:hypothetical protein
VSLLLAPACGGSADVTRSAGSSSTVAPSRAIPDGPASCAGPGRQAEEGERRLAEWTYAKEHVEAAPETPVWLGFARILSADEVGDALAPIEVLGVHLVYEQRQGTYAKIVQEMAPVPADAPEVEHTARLALAQGMGQPNLLDVGGADAFEPVDAEVRSGQPPFAGVLVSGDVAAAIAGDPCLVYSIAIDGSGTAAPLPPAIEPEMVLPDRG